MRSSDLFMNNPGYMPRSVRDEIQKLLQDYS